MNWVEKDLKDHLVATSLLQSGLPLMWALEWASTTMVWCEAVIFQMSFQMVEGPLHTFVLRKTPAVVMTRSWMIPHWSWILVFSWSKPGSTQSCGGGFGGANLGRVCLWNSLKHKQILLTHHYHWKLASSHSQKKKKKKRMDGHYANIFIWLSFTVSAGLYFFCIALTSFLALITLPHRECQSPQSLPYVSSLGMERSWQGWGSPSLDVIKTQHHSRWHSKTWDDYSHSCDIINLSLQPESSGELCRAGAWWLTMARLEA